MEKSILFMLFFMRKFYCFFKKRDFSGFEK